ncbi:hypothetical protein [Leucothrix arctica]|uniref:Big-1 domain-containing protein n=1 Tax=Leucothrix arctica TaxID=1481894 RepID=A0A317CED1_9GAMM|nr:hypothetical protein [Leucothrix arctica]PWQ94650.1 hypothetical protein DKT75_15265 [Leucothrix arctica]
MSLTQKTIKLALPLAISLALAACGGSSSDDSSSSSTNVGFGSNTTTDTSDTSTDTTDTTDTSAEVDTTTDETEAETETTAVAKLLVYASTTSLNSDSAISDGSSDPAIIYMMAKDSDNIALSDVTFSPSVSAGATLFEGEVSSDGTLTTWELVPEEPRNQTVLVTVSSGGITETLSIEIVGTTVEIDGASSISMNTPTTYTVKLKDAAGEGLSQQSVEITSSLITTTLLTDAQGEAQFDIQPTSGGEYDIEISALGATNSKTITVSPNAFNLDTTVDEIAVDTTQAITLAWTANGVAQANKEIYLSATRGQIFSNGSSVEQVTTDANGNATFDILSSTAGGTVITASDNTTSLSTSLPLEFVSTTPKYLNIQADPSIIAALGTSSILAQVNDINDNPVKNQVVVFNLEDTVDGKLSSSKATTNSAGKASVVYTAGNATSALDGVVITSHIEGVAKTAEEAMSGETFVEEDVTKLTVGGEAVRIAFGFDELLVDNSPFYEKTFGVIVTDNAGNPVANKQIDFTVTSIGYYKGSLGYNEEAGQWLYNDPFYDCSAHVEDIDKDGWLDDGEDYNNSGTLEPTNSTTISGNSATDDSGQATVAISYLQNYALWESVSITATVTVNGTEYKSKIEQKLHVLNADITGEGSPPNQISPYGTRDCEYNDIQLNGVTN